MKGGPELSRVTARDQTGARQQCIVKSTFVTTVTPTIPTQHDKRKGVEKCESLFAVSRMDGFGNVTAALQAEPGLITTAFNVRVPVEV